MASTYTNDLLDQFLDYKSLLKQVSDIARNLSDYQMSASKKAIPVDIEALLDVKKQIKRQMALIAQEVDYVTFDPHRAIDASLGLADGEKNSQITSSSSSSKSSESAVVIPAPSPNTGTPANLTTSSEKAAPPLANITDPQLFTVRLPIRQDVADGALNQGSKPAVMAGNPRAYRIPFGLTEIFAVAGDGVLYLKWINEPKQGTATRSNPGQWELFAPDDTILLSGDHDIAAVYRGDNSVDLRDIFALGADRKLWRKMYANGKWQPWQKVSDTTYASGPSVVCTGLARIDIAIRTPDATIEWLKWDGDAWSPTTLLSLGKTWYGQPCLMNLNKDASSTRLYCITQDVNAGGMFRLKLQDGQAPIVEEMVESNRYELPMSAVTSATDKDVGMLLWTGNGEMGTWAAQHNWSQTYAQNKQTSRTNLESRDMLSAPAAAATDTLYFAFAVRGGDIPSGTDPNGKGKVVCHMTDQSFNADKFGVSNKNAKYVISQQIYNNPCTVAYGSQVDVFACGLSGNLWRSHFDGKDWTKLDERI